MRRISIALLFLALMSPSLAATGGIAGAWKGFYGCAQGLTELKLFITQGSGKRITAFFHFQGGMFNPAVPEGCFAMAGTYDPKTRRLMLAPRGWLLHPLGYGALALEGVLDPRSAQLDGRITGPGCSRFHAIAAPELAALPQACLPAGGMTI